MTHIKKQKSPLKVGFDSKNRQTRKDYFLDVFSSHSWETIGFEIDSNGNVELVFKENCSMPY